MTTEAKKSAWKFRFEGEDVAADIRTKYGAGGDLVDIYAAANGREVHKWHHYLPIYERYFEKFRGKPVRMLEIGTWRGGSLAMWRDYFGPEAVIFGIDINPRCKDYDGEAAQVRIGSQADPKFLAEVIAEMGGVDIILDDGSHVMKHVRASLRMLFPQLAEGGVYMIEDMHTAYWKKFGGGMDTSDNIFNFVRKLIDDMHRWYHGGKPRVPLFGPMISGIHVHDSIIVLEKGPVHPPVASIRGGRTAETPAETDGSAS
ncbi:class I SAM-dependent methyltransferase [Rhodobacter capsulatus]|uniref:class I SAM-dependent methyltransferase n=1 Tax=Rhodobacter capsulatus TaxID=1061 RepID=UPI0003D2CDEC|nr:class I SAM-dependent methyltransferase [Rhodobacter capsulatus]ETD91238.1 hypothetical protein U713_03125 [Rhodobacter capsulatus YW2]